MALLCPECDSPIPVDLDEVEEGDALACDDCGADLEITSLDPLKVVVIDHSGYDDPEETSYAAGDPEDDV